MFLKPLLRNPSHPWTLVNGHTGAVLAVRVYAAVDSASRRQGLLGRTGLDDEALIIAPCNAVHTFFMRFPIDVVFAARDGRVVKVCLEVRPWRMAGAIRGFAAIELPAGAARRHAVAPGDVLRVGVLEPYSPSTRTTTGADRDAANLPSPR